MAACCIGAIVTEASASERWFDSRADYVLALNEVFALAQREILLFDHDLQYGDYQTMARWEQWQGFLAGAGAGPRRLVLVLQDLQYLQQQCPRLAQLLLRWSHILEFRQARPELARVQDGFVLVDGQHALLRPHVDYVRGKLILNQPARVRELQARWDEILQASEPGLSATTLGL